MFPLKFGAQPSVPLHHLWDKIDAWGTESRSS